MFSESAWPRRNHEARISAWASMRQRANLTEWMDEPSSYEDLRDCLRDIGRVSRVIGAHRPILHWLDRFGGSSVRPLHILDAGCGGGHLLQLIEQWAAGNRVSVKLTGVDLNPDAIRAAREFAPPNSPPNSSIQWAVGDVKSFVAAEPVDLIVSSFVAHHLDDAKLIFFLEWMERTARRGWLIHDLYRSRVAIAGYRAMAWAARWHPFVRHDGAVSIRRAFVPADWRRYVQQAGIAPHAVRIAAEWPARICVMREKES